MQQSTCKTASSSCHSEKALLEGLQPHSLSVSFMPLKLTREMGFESMDAGPPRDRSPLLSLTDAASPRVAASPQCTKIANGHSLAIFHHRLGYRKRFHSLREAKPGGFQTRVFPTFLGKGPDCVADPFGTVPRRCS